MSFKSKKLSIICFLIFIIVFISILIFTIVTNNQQVKSNTVGQIRLNIQTYLAGQDQVTHPSVISFENEWNGYKYWMAYTPYPNGNGEEENPSICVSNDLYKWETPKAMVNPIADNEETGCNELKDVHILYRKDLDRIEVWYLGRISENLNGDGTTLTLLRKYTTDGVHWSNYEIMDSTKYLSPTVVWNGEKYQMWGIGFDTYNTTGTFVYQESKDGFNWTDPIKCSIDGKKENLKIWHGAVTSTSSGYVFTFIETSDESQTIKFCESFNGIDFFNERSIVTNDDKTIWKNFYRPSLLIDSNKYFLFYGVVSDANEWYITFSSGSNIDNLFGLTKSDQSKMIQLDSAVTNTNSVQYKIKEVYEYMRNYIRFELVILIPVAYILLLLRKKYSKIYQIMCFFIITLLCFLYTICLIRPVTFYPLIAVILISFVEGFLITCVSLTFKNQKR